MTSTNTLNAFLIDRYKNSPHSCCKVIGKSMLPLMKNGDWVYLEPIAGIALNVGDIILFHNQDRFVVHRIVKITSSHVITKGDRTRSLDPIVPLQNVIGRVVAIQRGKTKVSFTNPFLVVHKFLIIVANQILINMLKKE